MKTVRIYGMASTIALAPPVPHGVEVWCCNDPKRAYSKTRPWALDEWTRWFNLHSKDHMLWKPVTAGGQTARAYPRGYKWYTEQTKPIYLQERQPDIPASLQFPAQALMSYFGTRYFTFSAAWLIALAVFEGFQRIELYGFMLSEKKPLYARERPCFFYWVGFARSRGIEVLVPKEVGTGKPGDPASYDGPLYGYETS